MAWTNKRRVEMQYRDARAERLTDLALAMIIPWTDGFPFYWLGGEENREERERQIFEATAQEVLPWQH
jgi:hypothetical protein